VDGCRRKFRAAIQTHTHTRQVVNQMVSEGRIPSGHEDTHIALYEVRAELSQHSVSTYPSITRATRKHSALQRQYIIIWCYYYIAIVKFAVQTSPAGKRSLKNK